MKKCLFIICAFLASCVSQQRDIAIWEEPDYNRVAANTFVVSKSPLYVTYEYKNIGVEELAPIAALYCQDRGGKQAVLYEITMHRNNSRRATFACQKVSEF